MVAVFQFIMALEMVGIVGLMERTIVASETMGSSPIVYPVLILFVINHDKRRYL